MEAWIAWKRSTPYSGFATGRLSFRFLLCPTCPSVCAVSPPGTGQARARAATHGLRRGERERYDQHAARGTSQGRAPHHECRQQAQDRRRAPATANDAPRGPCIDIDPATNESESRHTATSPGSCINYVRQCRNKWPRRCCGRATGTETREEGWRGRRYALAAEPSHERARHPGREWQCEREAGRTRAAQDPAEAAYARRRPHNVRAPAEGASARSARAARRRVEHPGRGQGSGTRIACGHAALVAVGQTAGRR